MGYGARERRRPASTAMAIRQPIGVCAAIAPFNFPAMVPLWFLPFAVVTGNTFVLKPSEQVPLTQQRMFELLATLRSAAGRRQPGATAAVRSSRRSASTPASAPCRSSARRRWRATSIDGAARAGKRVQALGGAKNFIVVMPDADLDRAIRRRSPSRSSAARASAAWPGRCSLPVGESATRHATGWSRRPARSVSATAVRPA